METLPANPHMGEEFSEQLVNFLHVDESLAKDLEYVGVYEYTPNISGYDPFTGDYEEIEGDPTYAQVFKLRYRLGRQLYTMYLEFHNLQFLDEDLIAAGMTFD